MKLILGSSSKYRKGLMEKAGYVFDILIPDLEEKEIKEDDPLLVPYVRKIEGDEESIVGMPIHLLEKLLKKAGYKS